MRALCIERPGEMRLVEIEEPKPAAGEVLIRVRVAGICGSDLELLRGTRPEGYCRYPIVPGHEWAGELDGRPVVAEGFRACGTCSRCAEGHTNLCMSGYAETGFTHQGAFAEQVCVPARFVHPLPVGIDMNAAALLEPAACVAEGLMHAGIGPSMSVAVVGAGAVGLLAVTMLRTMSPTELVVVGTNRERLELATRLGATQTVDSAHGLESRFDLVFEATNRPGGAQTAIDLARRGGTVVLEGINGSETPSVVSDSISLKQLQVRGVFGASSAAWRWVIDLFSQTDLHLDLLVTHRFGLEEFATAFATVQDRLQGAVKVQFVP